MDKNKNNMDGNNLLEILRIQMKHKSAKLDHEVQATMKSNEEVSAAEQAARDLILKHLNDTPIHGVLSLDFIFGKRKD